MNIRSLKAKYGNEFADTSAGSFAISNHANNESIAKKRGKSQPMLIINMPTPIMARSARTVSNMATITFHSQYNKTGTANKFMRQAISGQRRVATDPLQRKRARCAKPAKKRLVHQSRFLDGRLGFLGRGG
jgi:hypothetical protein